MESFNEYAVLFSFIYGLSFFTLGIITLSQAHKFKVYKLDHCLFSLGIFGVTQGLYKWTEIFSTIFSANHTTLTYYLSLEVVFVVISFIYLLRFGFGALFAKQKYSRSIINIITTVIFVMAFIYFYHSPQNTKLYICYLIKLPAYIVATIVFLVWNNYPELAELNSLKININRLVLAGIFIIFSLLTVIISPKINVANAPIFNNIELLIIIFQTTCAVIIAICIISTLTILDTAIKDKLDNDRRNKIDKYKKISEQDPLTKLQNRLGLQSILSGEIARARRYKRHLAALFIDIDDFKTYNDTYGHEAGDQVLVKFAEILHETLRETDYALRYGGDEFIVLLPETDFDEAFQVAERFRNKFNMFKFCPENNQHFIHKTVSIGIATYHSGTSATELIQQADKEMYKAKNHGKNQIYPPLIQSDLI